LSGWAGIEYRTGGKVTDLAATLVAVSDRNQIASNARLRVVVGTNSAAWAIGIDITRTTQAAASIRDTLPAVVAGAQSRITALSYAVCVVSASGCAGVAKQVAVLSSWALKVLGALARAVWQANRWVVVIRAAEPRWAVPIVAGFWIYAVGFLTNKSVGCTIKLVVTRW
jgi:hypothetical protein